jgi:hypothetical protein
VSTGAFLCRWSRRKRQATTVVEATNARGRHLPSPLDGDATKHDESRTRRTRGDVEATATECAQPVPRSDLPDLVPLEAIGPETDIRAFLAVGVPSELTRAALRRAWLSDPTIRDFVGLADYDWDFNTPGSMPGFGMLGAAEQIERELARLVRGTAAVTASETPVSPAPIGWFQTGEEHHSTPSCEPGAFARLEDESTRQDSTASDFRPEALADQPFRRQRKHGRALPK